MSLPTIRKLLRKIANSARSVEELRTGVACDQRANVTLALSDGSTATDSASFSGPIPEDWSGVYKVNFV